MTEGARDWSAAIREELGAATIEPAVRAMSGKPGAAVLTFDARQVEYPSVSPEARQLVRIEGTARDGLDEFPWSLVLKAFRHPEDPEPAVDEPTHYEYWQREPLFFESALSTDLPLGPKTRSGSGSIG